MVNEPNNTHMPYKRRVKISLNCMVMLESLNNMFRIGIVRNSWGAAFGFRLPYICAAFGRQFPCSCRRFSRIHPTILSRLCLLLSSCHLLREMQKVDTGSAFFDFATFFSSLQVLRNLHVHRLNQKGTCCVCWYFYRSCYSFTRFDDGKISHESRVRKYQWCNDVSILKLVGEKRRFRSRAFLYVPYSGFRDWLCDWTSPIFLPGSSTSPSVLMRASSSSMTY